MNCSAATLWSEPVRFKLTEEQGVQAAQLNSLRYAKRFLLFAFVTGVLTSVFFQWSRQAWDPVRDLLAAFLITSGTFVSGLLILGLMYYVVYPFHARKNLRQQNVLSEELSLSWNENDFCYASGKSRTEMPFANLHGYQASSEIILFYRSDAIYHMVPIAAFGSERLAADFLHKLEVAGLPKL
jgi:hypothetical protein